MDFLVDLGEAKWHQRKEKPNLLVLHRCDMAKPDPGYPDAKVLPSTQVTYQDLREHFEDTRPYRAGAYTGGKFPYAFVVEHSGRVVQTARIMDITPHARNYNTNGLGIVVVGDFRHNMLGSVQWSGLVKICAALLEQGCGQSGIVGHTNLRDASADPNKICPGKNLNVTGLIWAAKSIPPPEIILA